MKQEANTIAFVLESIIEVNVNIRVSVLLN
jgi:hypothetical protein